MRIKQGFVMRRVAGQTVIVATGEAAEGFRGMIKVNEAGGEIWSALSEGLDEAAVAQRLTERFEVSREVAERDVAAFVERMRENGFLAG